MSGVRCGALQTYGAFFGRGAGHDHTVWMLVSHRTQRLNIALMVFCAPVAQCIKTPSDRARRLAAWSRKRNGYALALIHHPFPIEAIVKTPPATTISPGAPKPRHTHPPPPLAPPPPPNCRARHEPCPELSEVRRHPLPSSLLRKPSPANPGGCHPHAGVLIEADPAVKSIIVAIDRENHEYIIEDLDEQRCVVKETMVAELKQKLDEVRPPPPPPIPDPPRYPGPRIRLRAARWDVS